MIIKTSRSYSMALDYLRRLVFDVPTDRMADQAHGLVNHPAWTIGHLVLSAQLIAAEMHVPNWLPITWAHRFGTGSVPIADVTYYPTKSLLLDALTDAQRRVLNRIAELGDAGMKQPLPGESMRTRFPTVGDAVLHNLTVHTALHVGQLIAWRRIVGLTPIDDFD